MRPPPKKETSGLTILLWVIGGGLLVMTAIAAVIVYFVASSPDGRRIARAVGRGVKISQKAQSVPGTKELRAAGCHTALVMDADELGGLIDDGDAGRFRHSPIGELVNCTMLPFKTPPDCERIADVYVAAVGKRPRGFMVTVGVAGSTEPKCTAFYDESGGFVRNIARRSAH